MNGKPAAVQHTTTKHQSQPKPQVTIRGWRVAEDEHVAANECSSLSRIMNNTHRLKAVET